MSKASDMIGKAKAALIIDHPFLASLLLPMPFEEDKTIPTMATDGDRVFFNPNWVSTLSQEEVIFVLAHETFHCVFDHMGRREHRGHNRWNQAADYIINGILVEEKDRRGKPVFTMPDVGLLDPALVAKGNGTAEGVYNLLPEDAEDKAAGQPGGALDQVFDAGSNMGQKPVDAATAAQKSAEMKVRVIQAKNAAKSMGSLSANLERLIEKMVKPKVDWRTVLRNFVSEKSKEYFSFSRPKRRFLADDLYLPGLTGERMGHLDVLVDCSGSVNTILLTKFATEINAIREDVKPSRVRVIYFDSRVLHVDTFEADDELVIKPRGGGGTAFSPCFKYINKHDPLPVAVVCLTDLYCSDYGPTPDYPVLWCVIEGATNTAVPFGEVVEVSEND
jgi:predicted metal-dependent peptidase